MKVLSRVLIAVMAIGLVAPLVILIAGREQAGAWLNVGEKPVLSDVVFVVDGGLDLRVVGAAAMASMGLVKDVIVVPRTANARKHKLSAAVLDRLGVTAEIDTTANQATGTSAEADDLALYIRERYPSGSVTVTLIANDYHTRRTRRIFERALKGMNVDLRVVGTKVLGHAPGDWWQTRRGRSAYLQEFVKVARQYVIGGL